MFKEFKEFAMRGNVVDPASGVIIGAAFSKIIGHCPPGNELTPQRASYAKRYIKATLSSKLSSWLVLNWTQWPVFIIG